MRPYNMCISTLIQVYDKGRRNPSRITISPPISPRSRLCVPRRGSLEAGVRPFSRYEATNIQNKYFPKNELYHIRYRAFAARMITTTKGMKENMCVQQTIIAFTAYDLLFAFVLGKASV